MAYVPGMNDIPEPNSTFMPSIGDVDAHLGSPQESGVSPSFMQRLGKILPKPQLPLGLNAVTGAIASLMPYQKKPLANAITELPQIATGAPYGIPQQIASAVGSTLPALAAGGEGIIGNALNAANLAAAHAKPGERGQAALQGGLLGGTLGGVVPWLSKLLPVKSDEVAAHLQSAHDALQDTAKAGFKQVSKAVKDRNINNVPIFGEGFINDAKKYLPQTEATNRLLDNAATGDFDALRKLQTNLWQRGTKRLTSPYGAENDLGEEMLDLRERINDRIANHLVSHGHEDLNQLLNQSRANFANLRQTFYNKGLPVPIRRLVNPDVREIPVDIYESLGRRSEPLNRLSEFLSKGSFAPEQQAIMDIPGLINAHQTQQNAFNWAKRLGLLGTGVAGGLALYHALVPHKPVGLHENTM